MKHITIICLLLGMGLCTLAQSKETVSTQTEKNFDETEKELKAVYSKVVQEYKHDSLFIKHLKKTQSLWAQFRNAELEMKYPDTINGRNSTSYYQCIFSYKEKLTRERINALKVWLAGIKENEECSGTLKIKK